jgi:tryptophanyl-tRNA synthetase
MHLGHLIPFIFTKWLQETLDTQLIIQIAEEEKSAFKKESYEKIYKLGKNNAKDIASLGFDYRKTFIFMNRDYRLKCKNFEILTSHLKSKTSLNEIKKIFGFTDDASISMIDWPFYQTSPAFYQSFPNIFKDKPAYCLVPHAIDQDPYFRLGRDLPNVIKEYKLIKPCNIMSKFVPPLSGDEGKMSSSEGVDSTIFLNDSEVNIRKKVLKYTFSGGGGDGSLKDHKLYGGNPEKDMAFQYLKYFEYDDFKL